MASPASTTRTSWRAAWQPDMTHPPIPAATRETCDECSKNLEAARELVLHAEISQDPAVRAQGLYLLQMLQAFGFNIYVAPRQAYPNFYLHSIFMPFESGFGAPCPDFFYRWAFLDGKRSYRIRGKQGTTRWIEFQAHKGFWGDPDQGHLGNHDLDSFKVDADGRFEIIASPDEHEGNWIPLDPTRSNIVMMVREAWYDWDREQGAEFHIEAIDLKGEEPMALDEAEMNRRMLAVSRLVKIYVEFFQGLNKRIDDGGGRGRFGEGFGHIFIVPMPSAVRRRSPQASAVARST